MMRTAKQQTTAPLDPLYVIFEQHLYNFKDSDADRKTFILNIVGEYLTFLRRKSVLIPKSLEPAIVDELARQVNTMLVKKIYGCLTIQDYQRKVPAVNRKRARSRYSRVTAAK
jgi:hypothetical protein